MCTLRLTDKHTPQIKNRDPNIRPRSHSLSLPPCGEPAATGLEARAGIQRRGLGAGTIRGGCSSSRQPQPTDSKRPQKLSFVGSREFYDPKASSHSGRIIDAQRDEALSSQSPNLPVGRLRPRECPPHATKSAGTLNAACRTARATPRPSPPDCLVRHPANRQARTEQS